MASPGDQQQFLVISGQLSKGILTKVTGMGLFSMSWGIGEEAAEGGALGTGADREGEPSGWLEAAQAPMLKGSKHNRSITKGFTMDGPPPDRFASNRVDSPDTLAFFVPRAPPQATLYDGL